MAEVRSALPDDAPPSATDAALRRTPTLARCGRPRTRLPPGCGTAWLLLLVACTGCGKARDSRSAPAPSPSVTAATLAPSATGPQASAASPLPALSSAAREIPFPSGVARVRREDDADHVVVTSTNPHLESESFCPTETGSYDEMVSFFQRLQSAVASGAPAAVAPLVRYPLRVNDEGRAESIHSAADLTRRYAQIFDRKVTRRIRDSEPHAVFCRNGSAMLGDGVVWAHAEKGVVGLDVVNR